MRSTVAEKIAEKDLPGLQTAMDIAGQLVDYNAEGHQVKIFGKEMLVGNECYKIKPAIPAGGEISFWMDEATFLHSQSSAAPYWPGSAGNPETVIQYWDYRKVAGIQFPHAQETKIILSTRILMAAKLCLIKSLSTRLLTRQCINLHNYSHNKKIMKRLISGLLALMALINVQGIKAQTADEVVDKYTTAMGGKEKLMSLKSVKMTGNLSVQGIDVGITVTVVNGVGSRNDLSVPGMGEGFQIIGTQKGWNFMPFQGQTAPEEVSEDQLKSSQGLLDLQGLLFNYKEKGSTVELLAKEKVETADCYKMKLTNKLGKVFTLFIDAATGYRVKSIAKVQTPAGEEDAETTYSDFKKTDDGYIFPFSQTSARGTIVFSSIEVNRPVDERIFTAH